MEKASERGKVQSESLEEEATHVLDEARMVLPGIQALFGFQLIAVFNQRFASDLDSGQQLFHLAALLLVAISVATIMTPAAYHRQAERGRISLRFVRLASWLVALAMLPLAAGMAMDLFVVASMITRHRGFSVVLAGLLFCGLIGAWFAFPWLSAARAHWPDRS